MDPRVADDVSLPDLFEQFVEATTMRNVLAIHQRLLNYANLSPCEFNLFFPKFKRAITASRQKKNWKAKALFSKIDKRAAHKCYSNTKAAPTGDKQQCDTNSYSNQQRGARENEENEENEDTQASSEESSSIHLEERNFSNNNALKHYNCLVIGSGPAGLRTAIELQLLGASRVVIVEKRGRFSRNNVLHLWPFVIDDLKSLGAKKFYGKFCAGSIDHISIRQLQLMLLKVCLMIGCDFRDSCSYVDLCPASLERKRQDTSGASDLSLAADERSATKCNFDETTNLKQEDAANSEHDAVKASLQDSSETITAFEGDGKPREVDLRGVRAHFQCDYKPHEEELHSQEWDIILGADGRRNTLSGFFPRMEFRGRLAIAITANFINRQTPAETSVPEISGLSFIYNQDMFNTLAYDTNIQLENICYYKDDTHYFVMTAKKRSLLERGVLMKDYAATKDLLSDDNVDREALLKYAKDAAFWTTGLEPLDFALNHYGQEDCAMFDFTSMYAASNACRALRTKRGGLALFGLVGDSLLEPFWPTGSGCARGFLSSFDAAWMCRQWAVNQCAIIDTHGSSASAAAAASRSSRNQGATNGGELGKPVTLERATYDRMAMNVIAERESIYRILAQTTSENLQQNYSHWTLNPHTRYPNLNRHLVSPAQVEHLVASSHDRVAGGSKLLSPKSAATAKSASRRTIKSPTSSASATSRRSPKKLKSAGASPMAQPKNLRNLSKSKYGYKSRSRNDITIDDYYLEFEQSYRDLDDTGRGGTTQYLNYKQRNSLDLDDLFIPSLSGTLPSSNNLSKLEARKARDIDECLRQRRQKSKIHIVRDQLISQMRGEKTENGKPILSGGNAVLFNEIRRMREQQTRGARGDSKPRDLANGPLSLLNSMRRCASFAERVKSFEKKLINPSGDTPESIPSTPKTPIDNVKNLPQFATLQELIINNAQQNGDQAANKNKSRIPVTKLSRDDWNVKCWEKRLTTHSKQSGLSLSSRSLNKSVSVDRGQDQLLASNRGFATKPRVQVDVFQDRIKEMAGKLEISKDSQRFSNNNQTIRRPANQANNELQAPVRSQNWINHLKRELSKGSSDTGGASYRRSVNGQPMNPVVPNKPIKKLFEDDDDDDGNGDDDGIDVNKHYDHLCINRPTNKYLAKGAYTSHMARIKYNSATSRVINRPKPTNESKQAYHLVATMNSTRNSSASSTLSDYSTNTGNSSSGSASTRAQAQASSLVDVECFRCKKFVSTADRITLGSSSLHRSCLTCAQCGLTLRTNEIQHYLGAASSKSNDEENQDQVSFLCAICKPDLRADLSREADGRLAVLDECSQTTRSAGDRLQQSRLQSREEFLNTRINYKELYRNILSDQENKTDGNDQPTTKAEPPSHWTRSAKVTPSPIQVTLPMKLVTKSRADTTESELGDQIDDDDDDEEEEEDDHEDGDSDEDDDERRSSEFSISESHTIDGREQVTVILSADHDDAKERNHRESRIARRASASQQQAAAPAVANSSRRVSKESEMIDEEELHRILHLSNRQTSRKSSDASSSSSAASSGGGGDNDANGRDDKDDDGAGGEADQLGRQREGSGASGLDHRDSDASSSAGDESSSSPSSANATTDDNSSSLDIPSDSE